MITHLFIIPYLKIQRKYGNLLSFGMNHVKLLKQNIVVYGKIKLKYHNWIYIKFGIMIIKIKEHP